MISKNKCVKLNSFFGTSRNIFLLCWRNSKLCQKKNIKSEKRSHEHLYIAFFPVIKHWSVSAPYSHLAGGMTYQDGKLTVPIAGRYYIYAQIYYLNNGRAHIRVNNNVVTLPQPPVKGAVNDSGAVYTGGVFNLKAGDVISLDGSSYPVSSIKIYMYSIHTFFGAYMIWTQIVSWRNSNCTISSWIKGTIYKA